MSFEVYLENVNQYLRDMKVFLLHDYESNIVLLNFLHGIFLYLNSSLTIPVNECNQYLEKVKISIEICSDWVMKCHLADVIRHGNSAFSFHSSRTSGNNNSITILWFFPKSSIELSSTYNSMSDFVNNHKIRHWVI